MEPAETFPGLKRYTGHSEGIETTRSFLSPAGDKGEPPRAQNKNVDWVNKEILMSDEQTPIVETQSAQDSGTGGDDGDCCRAPGEPDGGPDT
jgi:hypothetical protein